MEKTALDEAVFLMIYISIDRNSCFKAKFYYLDWKLHSQNFRLLNYRLFIFWMPNRKNQHKYISAIVLIAYDTIVKSRSKMSKFFCAKIGTDNSRLASTQYNN